MIRRIFGSAAFPQEILSPIVALGNFDGVHRAHVKLLEQVHTWAKHYRGTTVVYTFDPHPVKMLSPESCPPLLQTQEQKLLALEKQGIEICVLEPFTTEFSQKTPEYFLEEILHRRLRAKCIVVGYDFTFGMRRAGNIPLLEKFCREHQIDIHIVPAQFQKETLMSSTHIRKLLLSGDIARANSLLGYPYQLWGEVVRGRGLGESLGAHTANLELENELIPADGVYLTRTEILEESSKIFPSITSIGNNPTFPGSERTVETHFLDQVIEVQGKRLSVHFLEWMREQIAFETPDALKHQIAADLHAARKRHEIDQRTHFS
ncbi:MAG: riboflavin biosynthesis protein RibF [Deltaproteobacteria bacterium RIFCSPLOWO2_02_FULL_44_10]|nr:MAG: riboflavin biosynthesis protein RibF [Deltaproteobacteria bacterium RIFCSPHIGHO2_02_FULL_44_16]OGQ46944.1 MAG: riboflavin biosynthesis protein RibF [Deltaproteobacteria bacterium RIFCSPLOWO2_02_FULL_44_10]